MSAKGPWGFTLIELLVVVAILAILAVMALPNFQEAMVRTKVSRVRADHHSLMTAFEAYRIDHNAYPSAESNGTMKWATWVTTPVAYIASVHIDDPFTGKVPDDQANEYDSNASLKTYRYYGFNEKGYLNARTETGEVIPVYYSDPGVLKVSYFVLFSHGPDRVRSKGSNGKTFLHSANLFDGAKFCELIYDATNGTVSNGEILWTGGAPVGRASDAMSLIHASQ